MILTNFVMQLETAKRLINLLLNLSCLHVNRNVNHNLKEFFKEEIKGSSSVGCL